MGNFKWNINDSNRELPYVVVLMISRNKDNSEIKGFKERKYSYLARKDYDKISKKFKNFVNDGVNGEMSRLYISLNTRNVTKIKKELLHLLIDKDEILYEYIEPMIAGIAARKENAAEKKWFFDFDSDDFLKVQDFVQDILNICQMNYIETRRTPHGYAVIVEKGFDTRKLLEKWKDIVTLKRDDLICYSWRKKNEKTD